MTASLTVVVPPRWWLSANDRLHWAEKARRTKALRAMGFSAWHRAGRPTYDRARLTVDITWPDRRQRDAANAHPTIKALIDGMVHPGPKVRGILPDDSDEYLLGPDLRPTGVSGYGAYVLGFDFEALA